MNRKYRFVLFLLSISLLLAISLVIEKNLSTILSQFWFSSGLLLVILLSLIDQPHFSKDTNIFGNGITAAVSLVLVPAQNQDWLYWTFYVVAFYLILSSYALFWLRDNPLNEERPFVQFLARLNRTIGKPESLFSALFLWSAIQQFGLHSTETVALFWFWFGFMVLNIPQVATLIAEFFSNSERELQNSRILGRIFGVQSKFTFLVKLLPAGKRPLLRLFDFVEFKYSIEERERVRRGMVLDTYWLNDEQWIKVLTNREIAKVLQDVPLGEKLAFDTVYKLNTEGYEEFFQRFIGIVTENSSIKKLRFIYNSRREISEGQLLEVGIGDQNVIYQVLEGFTKIELLENKNESGQVVGEAVQLGTWNSERFQFEQFGWVPGINTPVYYVSKFDPVPVEDTDILVGTIPDTSYPVILNKEIAITHHMAILGVTGTGKSVFARNLIREYMKNSDTKIVVVDFTGEYKVKFRDQKHILKPIVTPENEKVVYDSFEWINNELEKFGNLQDKDKLKREYLKIAESLRTSVAGFLEDKERQIAVVELPEVSNSSNILEFTKYFFRELFKYVKNKPNKQQKICVVLEEAHTVIPEWSFSGDSSKLSQSALNSISQIALQGRKYNIGLMVIAQRTANVSKTILTQCNSVISFQEYDKTSIDFLSNYFGTEVANVLPSLRFRRAIAAGKAFKASVPMMFEVPVIEEKAGDV